MTIGPWLVRLGEEVVVFGDVRDADNKDAHAARGAVHNTWGNVDE